MKHRNRGGRKSRGAVLVEYGLLVAGIALISVAAVSMIGHKTSDLLGTVAVVLPGSHTDDAAPIVSGKLVETKANADGNIALDAAGVIADNGKARIDLDLGYSDGTTDSALVKEAH